MQSKANENIQPVRVGPGVFGYLIHDPLSQDAENAIADFAKIIEGTEQDIQNAAENGFPYLSGEDLKGIYYAKPAIAALSGLGIKLEFMDQPVQSAEDIDAIIARNDR